jgi:hypothetical protein
MVDANAQPLRDGPSHPADAAVDARPRTDAAAGCDSGVASIACLLVVDAEHSPASIAVDDNNVYWSEGGQTTDMAEIVRVPRTGGQPVTLAHGATSSLVSDGSYVYFTDFLDLPQRHVLRVPVDGGAVVTLAPADSPQCLTVDDQDVYWTDRGGVLKVAKAGGATVTVAPPSQQIQHSIVVDQATVYWAANGVFRVSKDGGAVGTLVDGASGTVGGPCRGLALSAGGLFASYYARVDAGGSALVRVPLAADAGGLTTLVSSGDPTMLVASSTDLFWTGFGPMLDIHETPADGGPSTTLATPDVQSIHDIVCASDGTLYWTTDTQVQSFTP